MMDPATENNTNSRPLQNRQLLPPEILYKIVGPIVAEYIDTFVTASSPPDLSSNVLPNNPVLSLLQTCHQIREVTLEVLCDLFILKRETDGSLSEDPFLALAQMRQTYRVICNAKSAPPPEPIPLPVPVDANSQSVAEDNKNHRTSILSNYYCLAVGELCLKHIARGGHLSPGMQLAVAALSVPKGRWPLYQRVWTRARDLLVLTLSTAHLVGHTTRLELCRQICVHALSQGLPPPEEKVVCVDMSLESIETIKDYLVNALSGLRLYEDIEITGQMIELSGVIPALLRTISDPPFSPDRNFHERANALLEKWTPLLAEGWEDRYVEPPYLASL
ncbi:hypothetical protein JAAARDRAFT_206328 [Jaapia argillacea MUCL 33604]|uniref:Uncharacterized protein n=1 Tax=Jaapia argillacea MUCL 33604 TaxID=933084 RepID=A0A067Q4H8_9AGAM|nr:hypothetical protein JAAARDRAFT_206328 [Jaapia argillacea MUCL 33604]